MTLFNLSVFLQNIILYFPQLLTKIFLGFVYSITDRENLNVQKFNIKRTDTKFKYSLEETIWKKRESDQSNSGKYIKICALLLMWDEFNPLNTKRRPLYLKTQFVPRSKHFSSRL